FGIGTPWRIGACRYPFDAVGEQEDRKTIRAPSNAVFTHGRRAAQDGSGTEGARDPEVVCARKTVIAINSDENNSTAARKKRGAPEGRGGGFCCGAGGHKRS